MFDTFRLPSLLSLMYLRRQQIEKHLKISSQKETQVIFKGLWKGKTAFMHLRRASSSQTTLSSRYFAKKCVSLYHCLGYGLKKSKLTNKPKNNAFLARNNSNHSALFV